MLPNTGLPSRRGFSSAPTEAHTARTWASRGLFLAHERERVRLPINLRIFQTQQVKNEQLELNDVLRHCTEMRGAFSIAGGHFAWVEKARRYIRTKL